MNVNILTLSLTLVISGLIFLSPRRYVMALVLAAACYLPLFTSIDVAGLNMSMIRLIIFFAWCRFLVRREFKLIDFNKVDFILLAFLISSILTYTILHGTTDALINRCGMAYDIAGAYFMFRILIRNIDDILQAFKILAVLVVPIALAMLNERITESNLFSILGSPTVIEGYVRDDRIRAFGPFAHPILAGSFGATCVAFFTALWMNGYKILAVIGFLSSAVIVFTSNSSGPVMTTMAVIIGFAMWNFRNHMRMVRWLLLIGIVSLHVVMKAPIWFLIGKLGHLIGGGGWHRSEIIEAAVRHFNEWWFLGTMYTRHWMPTGVTWSKDHTDITNQFVRVGVDGGLFTLILYVFLFVLCFSALGNTLKSIRDDDKALKIIIWAAGVALFAHIVTFFSVRYFDQNILFFYMLIAIIAFLKHLYQKTPTDQPLATTLRAEL